MPAKSISSGLWGATNSAKMPATIITAMTRKLAAPSGWRRQKSMIALRGRGSATADAVGAAIVMSAVPDARIEDRIEEIDHEIDHHIDRCDQHHHGLDQGKIVARHALHE